MEEDIGKYGANDCLATTSLLYNASTFIEGAPLTAHSFVDLCSLIEMFNIHDKVYTPCSIPDALAPLQDAGALSNSEFDDLRDSLFASAVNAGQFMAPPSGNANDRAVQYKQRLKIFELLSTKDLEDVRTDLTPDRRAQIEMVISDFHGYKDHLEAVFTQARGEGFAVHTSVADVSLALPTLIHSAAHDLYAILAGWVTENVDTFLAREGFINATIPPFSLVVLGGWSKTRDDIVPAILRAREEFTEYRSSCLIFAERCRSAENNREVAMLCAELNNACSAFNEKIASKIAKRIAVVPWSYLVWDVVKVVEFVKAAVKSGDAAKEWDIRRRKLKLVQGVFDVWDKVQAARKYVSIWRSGIFMGEYNDADFQELKGELDQVRLRYPIKKPPTDDKP